MLEINELTRQIITVEFFDENGAAVIPASFTWRLQEPDEPADVIAVTTVVPVAATHELTIPASCNRCNGDNNELRRLTVVAAGLVAVEFVYKLRSLKGI